MTRQIEARLIDTLAAMADQITEDQLPDRSNTFMAQPHVVDVREARRTRNHSRWVAPLLAAASVAALVASALAVHDLKQHKPALPNPANSGSTSPAPTPTVSNSVTPQPQTKLLPFGVEGTARDLPVDKIGPGWTAATWRSSDTSANPTLFVIDPLGGRYRIATMTGDATVTAWSADHTLVSVQIQMTGDSYSSRSELWEIATGRKVLTVTSPNHNGVVRGFTPDGKSLLVDEGDQIWLYGLDGKMQVTYPSGYYATGTGGAPLFTPDGRSFLVTSSTGGALRLMSTAGTLGAQIPTPGETCSAEHWWDSSKSALLFVCFDKTTQASTLRTLNLDTLAFTTVTDTAGITAAWQTPDGIVAQSVARQGEACTLVAGTLDGTGVFTKRPLAKPDGIESHTPELEIRGVGANVLTVTTGCHPADTPSIVQYDLATGKPRVVLGPGQNGGRADYGLWTINDN